MSLARLALSLRPHLRRAALATALAAPASYCLSSTHCDASANALVLDTHERGLSWWQRASNTVYNAPFKSILALVVPAYGAVFAYESTNPKTASMLLSQRLIHTRVYGQAIAVLTTVSVMSYVSMMEKQGGVYRLEQGAVVRGPQQLQLRHWYSASDEEQRVREQQIAEQYERTHGPSADLLLPLVYAPLLPLVWLALRNRMPTHRLTGIIMGITGVAFVHGVYVMVGDSSMTMG